MKILIKIFFLLLIGFQSTYGQFLEQSFEEVGAYKAEVIYYPYQHNVQLVEIDYYSGYSMHLFQYHDRGYVPPYRGKSINEFFFRDTSGKIIRWYNTSKSIDSFQATLEPTTYSNRVNHKTTQWNTYNQTGKSHGYYNVYKDSMQGIIDSLGNVVIPCAYDYIIHKPNCFLGSKNSRWALIKLKSQTQDTTTFQEYHVRDPLIYFSNNRKLVSVYNHESQVQTDLTELEDIRLLSQGTEGMAWVMRDGKWGLWNYKTNTEVLRSEYETGGYFLYLFNEKYGKVVRVSKNGKYGLISLENDQPKVLLRCEYDKIYPTKESKGPPYDYKLGFVTAEKEGQIYEYDLKSISRKPY